jgi:hypothetical protein
MRRIQRSFFRAGRASAVLTVVGLLVVASASAIAQTQPQPAPKPALWRRLLAFIGVSASPTAQRDGGPAVGELWVAGTAGGKARRVTERPVRSPVFLDADTILALADQELVRIDVARDTSSTVAAGVGLYKLVGVKRDDPGQVLAVRLDRGQPIPGIFTVSNGRWEPVPGAPDDLVDHLLRWTRDYGDTLLDVRSLVHEGTLGRRQSVTDVFVVRDHQASNVSRCAPASCGQPSLSPDGTKVAFVRAAPAAR